MWWPMNSNGYDLMVGAPLSCSCWQVNTPPRKIKREGGASTRPPVIPRGHLLLYILIYSRDTYSARSMVEAWGRKKTIRGLRPLITHCIYIPPIIRGQAEGLLFIFFTIFADEPFMSPSGRAGLYKCLWLICGQLWASTVFVVHI